MSQRHRREMIEEHKKLKEQFLESGGKIELVCEDLILEKDNVSGETLHYISRTYQAVDKDGRRVPLAGSELGAVALLMKF